MPFLNGIQHEHFGNYADAMSKSLFSIELYGLTPEQAGQLHAELEHMVNEGCSVINEQNRPES